MCPEKPDVMGLKLACVFDIYRYLICEFGRGWVAKIVSDGGPALHVHVPQTLDSP